jgi:glycosyltransferase involved in cell wall biosynthesis
MFTIVIPAYNPDNKLSWLIDDLYKNDLKDIIVVNDGSSEASLEIFRPLAGLVTVLTHEVNQGKGAAIKTALKYLLERNIQSGGIILMDADGQHRVEDAIRLIEKLREGAYDMVLGVRSFNNKIPFRSRFGNTLTKYVFRLCSGRWISDTQTGLRAFSYGFIEYLLDIQGNRYEYEMNVLLACAKEKRSIAEVPIPAIYHDKDNSCSHFRTIQDSMRIYGNLIKYSGASFVSFLLDYALFLPLVGLFQLRFSDEVALILGNVMARSFSATLNYYLNSVWVFHHKGSYKKSAVSYLALAVMILYLNSLILYFFHNYLGMNQAMAKLFTEILLFGFSFCVQHFVIFSSKLEQGGSMK